MASLVYEKFYHVDTSDSAIEGTDPGISIVKHIVGANGGKIWVESELGIKKVAKYIDFDILY